MNETPTREELIGIWNGSEFPTQETTIVICRDGRGLYFYYCGSDDRGTFVDEFDWTLGDQKIDIVWKEHQTPRWALPGYDGTQTEDDEDEFVTLRDAPDIAACWFQDEEKSRLTLAIDIDFAHAPTLRRAGSDPVFEAERIRFKNLAENFDPFGEDRQVWFVDEEHNWIKGASEPNQSHDAYRPIPGAHRLPIVLGCIGLLLSTPQHPPDILCILGALIPLCILKNFNSKPISNDHEGWYVRKYAQLYVSIALCYCIYASVVLIAHIDHHWKGSWLIPMLLIAIGTYTPILIFGHELRRQFGIMRRWMQKAHGH
jgi:hypothetical protein